MQACASAFATGSAVAVKAQQQQRSRAAVVVRASAEQQVRGAHNGAAPGSRRGLQSPGACISYPTPGARPRAHCSRCPSERSGPLEQ